jgi:hypothetical protein
MMGIYLIFRKVSAAELIIEHLRSVQLLLNPALDAAVVRNLSATVDRRYNAACSVQGRV